MMVSIVLGLGSGVSCGATVEFLDDTIRSENDLQGTAFQPVLSCIPIIESETKARRRRWKWIIIWLFSIVVVGLGLYLFHVYVMDLEIFWLRTSKSIMRRINRLF
jgi:hypothetical protein